MLFRSANFLFDGIIKNMGFAAGAALSGELVFAPLTQAFSSIPAVSKLFSIGKAGEAAAAVEEGLLSANKASETYGKIKSLSDKYLSTYQKLNTGQRAVVAGLSTSGEASIEAMNNLNEFRDQRIKEYKNTHGGLDPIGDDLEKINKQAENVGDASFALNTALLTATNYIQFPKILGSSYKAEKGIINELARDTREIVKDAAGNYIEKVPTTKFGKILSILNKIRP